MMAFFGRQFSKPSQPGTRNSVKHEGARACRRRRQSELALRRRLHPADRIAPRRTDFFCYIYATPHGFNAVAFADAEYPSRVAFGYLAQLGEVFMQSTGGQLPRGAALTEGCMNGAFKGTHDAMLLKFQDPAEADQLTSIMRQLDETKLVLVRARRTRATHRLHFMACAAGHATAPWPRARGPGRCTRHGRAPRQDRSLGRPPRARAAVSRRSPQRPARARRKIAPRSTRRSRRRLSAGRKSTR